MQMWEVTGILCSLSGIMCYAFPFEPLYFFHIDSFLLTLHFIILLLPYSLLQFFFLIIPFYYSFILIVYLLGEVDADRKSVV